MSAIAPRVELAEIHRSERKPTESLDAIDLYYRAIHSFRRMTREGQDEALRLALQAITLDPNFSAAYGVATRCYSWRYQQGWTKDDDQTEIGVGKHYASRAIELGADDALALTIGGHYFAMVLKETETGSYDLDQAFAVNPNLSFAWAQRGWTSAFLDRHEVAVDQFQYARRSIPSILTRSRGRADWRQPISLCIVLRLLYREPTSRLCGTKLTPWPSGLPWRATPCLDASPMLK